MKGGISGQVRTGNRDAIRIVSLHHTAVFGAINGQTDGIAGSSIRTNTAGNIDTTAGFYRVNNVICRNIVDGDRGSTASIYRERSAGIRGKTIARIVRTGHRRNDSTITQRSHVCGGNNNAKTAVIGIYSGGVILAADIHDHTVAGRHKPCHGTANSEIASRLSGIDHTIYCYFVERNRRAKVIRRCCQPFKIQLIGIIVAVNRCQPGVHNAFTPVTIKLRRSGQSIGIIVARIPNTRCRRV